jgi:hypothetical protein
MKHTLIKDLPDFLVVNTATAKLIYKCNNLMFGVCKAKDFKGGEKKNGKL